MRSRRGTQDSDCICLLKNISRSSGNSNSQEVTWSTPQIARRRDAADSLNSVTHLTYYLRETPALL